MTRAQLLDQWLEGEMPVRKETRKEFLLRGCKIDEETAMILVDWIWNAGFNAGLDEGLK